MNAINHGKGLPVIMDDPDWRGRQASTTSSPLSEAGQSPWLSRLSMIWLMGTIVLLPFRILNLPFNFELVDIWILSTLPVALVFYSFRRHHIISLSYTLPMWLILVSSLISTFAAHTMLNGIIVILKEVYLFVWFIAVIVFLCVLNPRDLRRVLYVWTAAVILHGLLMVAQFFSPEIWRFTNSLGEDSARLVNYRVSGLFICDAAGCANKAAYFQLLGFVPLLLAGFSKKTTSGLGIFLMASILITGSMGATLAFVTGALIVIFTVALVKRNPMIAVRYLLQLVLASLVLGGIYYLAVSQNPGLQIHVEKITVGRYEKSSGGRFYLWQRGVNVLLEHKALLWGVGPENFRMVDAAGTDNQLHNDTLAFLVERGLLGVLGLALFPIISIRKAVNLLQIHRNDSERGLIVGAVFMAFVLGTFVESLTHQIFHARELWLVLAMQEAILFNATSVKNRTELSIRTLSALPKYHPGPLVQPEATVGRG